MELMVLSSPHVLGESWAEGDISQDVFAKLVC